MTGGRFAVALINNFAGPSLGGGEVHLLALLRELPRRGVDPIVVCASGSALADAAAAIDGVEVVAVEFKPSSMVWPAGALVDRLRGVDVVHGTGFMTNIISRRVGRRLGAVVVNTVHVVPGAARLDGESWSKSLVRAGLDRSTRSGVHRYIAVSTAVASGLMSDGVQGDLIAVVPNGVDVQALRLSAAMPLAVPLGEGRPRIGYVGRLERVKGIEYFVWAAARILEDVPEARFIVAGSGSLQDAVERWVVDLGVDGRFELLGHVSSIPPLLAALDVVVVPSLSEASGLTAMESLAVGVPVVATRVGGLPDVIVDGETGLLVPSSDAEAIAVAVEGLVCDPERGRKLSAAGARRVEECFTIERMVAGYLEVYRQLLS